MSSCGKRNTVTYRTWNCLRRTALYFSFWRTELQPVGPILQSDATDPSLHATVQEKCHDEWEVKHYRFSLAIVRVHQIFGVSRFGSNSYPAFRTQLVGSVIWRIMWQTSQLWWKNTDLAHPYHSVQFCYPLLLSSECFVILALIIFCADVPLNTPQNKPTIHKLAQADTRQGMVNWWCPSLQFQLCEVHSCVT